MESGLIPIPPKFKDMFTSAEGLVRVQYSSEYSCALCGFCPPHFGCIPALEEHLKERHGVVPEKALWIAGLTDSQIKRNIPRAATEKGFDQPAG